MNKDINLDTTANSTWLNPGVTTLSQLKDWILTMLGAPLITVELEDNQLNVCIQNALEKYTKYAYFPEKYLAYNLKFYETGKGADLGHAPDGKGGFIDFKVLSVKDLAIGRDRVLGLTNSDIFFGPQAWFMGNGGYPFFGSRGNFAGSFTTYHNLHEFFELTNRMTGSNPDWFYDKSTKILTLFPEPKAAGKRNEWILLTCQTEPQLEELYGNEYVKRLALAQAKMLLGTVRSKFQNITLLGGGTVDTAIGDRGREEWDKLIEEIQRDEAKGQTWVIA